MPNGEHKKSNSVIYSNATNKKESQINCISSAKLSSPKCRKWPGAKFAPQKAMQMPTKSKSMKYRTTLKYM